MPSKWAPTSDQLRCAIDRGATGDKVRFPDPAAAPLGADDEAAGHAPSAAERRIAYLQERAPASERGDERLSEGKSPSPLIIALGSVAVIVLAIIWSAYWGR